MDKTGSRNGYGRPTGSSRQRPTGSSNGRLTGSSRQRPTGSSSRPQLRVVGGRSQNRNSLPTNSNSRSRNSSIRLATQERRRSRLASISEVQSQSGLKSGSRANQSANSRGTRTSTRTSTRTNTRTNTRTSAKAKARANSRSSKTRQAASTGAGLVNQGISALIGSWENRDAWVVVFFLAAAAILIARLSSLVIIDGPSLQADAQEQRTAAYTLTARRGTIYDRNGNVLAISVDAVSVYVNPSQISDADATAKALRAVLGGTQQFYLDKIEKSTSPTFNYIYKRIEPALADELKAADAQYRQEFINNLPVGDDLPAEIITPLTGINYLYEPKRVYPYGNVGAQVIGALGDDGVGLSGIEQTFDSVLSGVDGFVRAERGKDGRPIPNAVSEQVAAIDGQDIILTLDIDLQSYVETKLADYGKRYQCENANTLLLDGASGEIHAAASLPLYNREKITPEEMENGATACKAITFGYEPGSVFKTVTAAAALEHDTLSSEDVVAIPAELELDEYTITDAFEHGPMEMSFREIMVNSSNIGMSLIEQKLGNQNFYEMIDCSGFGHPTHVDYPGESIGTVPDLLDWNIVSQANMSFGQGLQVSSLQVASFYGAIANYGVQIRPHFLLARPNENESPSYGATRIMSQYTAEQLESILRSVVEIHAPVANVDGYQVVGKTGTAEKASSDGGYLYNNHIVSFVGYMANSSSQMVCLTSFDNPLEQLTAPPTQPLFKEIMAFLANRSMVAQVDAVYEAKAALAAAAAAGEINGVATSDTNANAAGSTNGQGSATTGSNQSGQQSGSADTNEQAANSERLRSSLPQAYSVSDPAARPILAGTSEGWVLDTSG